MTHTSCPRGSEPGQRVPDDSILPGLRLCGRETPSQHFFRKLRAVFGVLERRRRDGNIFNEKWMLRAQRGDGGRAKTGGQCIELARKGNGTLGRARQGTEGAWDRRQCHPRSLSRSSLLFSVSLVFTFLHPPFPPTLYFHRHVRLQRVRPRPRRSLLLRERTPAGSRAHSPFMSSQRACFCSLCHRVCIVRSIVRRIHPALLHSALVLV